MAWRLLTVALFAVLSLQPGITTPVFPDADTPAAQDSEGHGNTECTGQDPSILTDRDLVLVDLARKLDSLAPNMTEAEKELLADLLDTEAYCTDEEIEQVMEERSGTGDHRAKRASCFVQCHNGNNAVNCSGRCSCKCNWWGNPKCRCL